MSSYPSDDDGDRGTGRTTRQIVRAPQGCVMVVPNQSHVDYSKRHAKKLGRADIVFVSLKSLQPYGWDRLRGCRGVDAVVLDHACWHFMDEVDRARFDEMQRTMGW